MRDVELQDVSSDLASWAQPVVIDQLTRYYFSHLRGQNDIAIELARQHARVWRGVLRGDVAQASEARRELAAIVQLARFGADFLDTADRLVLDELMQIVVTRFQRSPYTAQRYAMSLLETASGLAEARLAAA